MLLAEAGALPAAVPAHEASVPAARAATATLEFVPAGCALGMTAGANAMGPVAIAGDWMTSVR